MLIQAQLHLCLRKVHPNIRHNPSRQYVCRKRHPPNARMLGQHMRLSFASFTLQPPHQQTSPSPCHFVTSPFLSILWRRKGGAFIPRIRGKLEFCSRRSCTCVFAKCTRTHDTIPRDNTDTASSILPTLDCSDNICGCHLLHSLCNRPLNKPLHPPGLRPSPFLSDLRRRKGGYSYRINVILDFVRVKRNP